MKTTIHQSKNITRKQFKMFIALLIGGYLLTCIMAAGLQAQNLAMLNISTQKEMYNAEPAAASKFNEGMQALELNDNRMAIKLFSAAIVEHKTNAAIYHQRGIAYGRLNQWKSAIADFNTAIALDSTQAEYFYHRGLAENKMDKYAQCILDCNKALQLNSVFAEAYLVRGISKAILNDANGSMSDFRAAIVHKPGYAEAYYNIGLNYYEENDQVNASINLKKAKELGFENKELSFLTK